jgi:hypothetical protein
MTNDHLHCMYFAKQENRDKTILFLGILVMKKGFSGNEFVFHEAQ